MQTFLPYADFAKSAATLDRMRLGKQRVENLQIMKALAYSDYGWQNHPAVKMWRGYEWALAMYQDAICAEWTSRGYKDTCAEKTDAIFWELALAGGVSRGAEFPPWLGNEDLHLSHRSNLLRKNYEHYAPLFVGDPTDLEYVWPSAVMA